MLYLDWWVQHRAFRPYLKMLAAYYYNVSQSWDHDVMICYKLDAMAPGSGIVEMERGKFADIQPFAWQTDTSVAKNSWCYTEQNEYKSSREIIATLLDVVSKNGNLLLNIGPKADGTISEPELRILEDVGGWLKVNGEAVFGTRPFHVYGEGPVRETGGAFTEGIVTYSRDDFRFTRNGGCIYAAAMNPEGCDEFRIRFLRTGSSDGSSGFFGDVRQVSLLGSDEVLEFSRDGQALHIRTTMPGGSFPWVFRIRMD
jgi:alpha-L-fucosidase